MKITVAVITSLVMWFTAPVPASAVSTVAYPVPQGFDQAVCKLFPWMCPR